ncbi:MAG: toprim domain-containing protein [Verrucomicrobia bacterium]|nr:toprim domain-containing protein [Verrucomicrobiota bacterium]
MNKQFIGFDRLKQSISMEQVLGRYGLLETLRRGADSLSGVCPLHRGHNSTQFRVNLVKNCWICFGDCHGGGSIVDFVSQMEKVGIREAGLLLQDWFNLESGNGHEALRPVAKEKVIPIRKETNPPLRFSLGALDGAHSYLTKRGLTPETIRTFGLGYCSRGMLRGWVAIPIHDAKGNLVAYASRWPGTPPDEQPKYRLPCGFRKSLELFNQHRAVKESAAESLVVVEGFFGCMRIWQAGHRRVVSLMGSMLSPGQEDCIVQLAGESGHVLLLFDEDAAGRKGRAEAQERLGKHVVVNIVRLAEGQQPDSLEPEALLALIEQHSEKGVAA